MTGTDDPAGSYGDFETLLAGLDGWKAGITTARSGQGRGGADDYGLATGGSAWEVSGRYLDLARRSGFDSAAVARQVHGTELVSAELAPLRGLWIAGDADGFVGAATPGRMFAVTVADCVPAFVLADGGVAFALLHAGWRGAAAGILRVAIGRLLDFPMVNTDILRVHLGPAICGDCYSVGPEVTDAFGVSKNELAELTRESRDDGTVHFDLRAALARQAVACGVAAERITTARECTRCSPPGELFSHRGGGPAAGRMIAWIGRLAGPG